MSRNRTIFVLGNGPSLRGFDFHTLDGFDTLGMNAAYRHWDQIGWYPTYYCCLDDQLIQTHHLEILRLVNEGLVKGAFLHGSFFELHPECVKNDRYWSADQFHKYWYTTRGKELGFEYIDSDAFRTTDTSKITTGAYAVRFCAHVGYGTIALLGIDLKYVEMIPEAAATGEFSLVIKETPKHNPNYFFDDYQRAGDRFNVPNPAVHDGDLHPRSFKVLRDDFFLNLVHSRVLNCNPGSILEKDAVFPLATVERLVNKSLLGAVVVPCTNFDADQILSNFVLWATPAFAPCLSYPSKSRPKLVFVFNQVAGGLREEISQMYERTRMERFFSELEVHSLELSGEADAYVRSYDRPSGREGYKAGPNNQFFMTLRLARDYGRYIFLMEADCVPIRPDWLTKLAEIVDGAEPFFILGSPYRGIDRLSKPIARHINGNAVYAAGDQHFVDFVNDFWEPQLRRAVETDDRRLAYDCALEFAFNMARPDVEGDAIWKIWQKHAHRIRYTDFIQNISAPADLEAASADFVPTLLGNHPGTHLLHSQAAAGAARHLLGSGSYPESVALSLSPKPKATTEQPEFTEFHFVNCSPSALVERVGDFYTLPTGSASNYVMCKFTGVVRPGDTVTATLVIEVRERARLAISLCRDGDGAFESTRTINTVIPGSHTISLEHTFKGRFGGARVQIGSEDAPANIRVVSVKMDRKLPEKGRNQA